MASARKLWFRLRSLGRLSRLESELDQSTLHLLAHAHLLREERREAALALAAAIRAGGLQDAVLRQELAALLAGDPALREQVGDLAPPR